MALTLNSTLRRLLNHLFCAEHGRVYVAWRREFSGSIGRLTESGAQGVTCAKRREGGQVGRGAVCIRRVLLQGNIMRGRDPVLQAVLADLQRAREELQTSEAKVTAKDAEVAALQAELSSSGEAAWRAHAKVTGSEATRKEMQEAGNTAQKSMSFGQMRDMQMASLRKELRESRAEIASLRKDLLETRTAHLQRNPSTEVAAQERCKFLEALVERLSAEVSLKDSKLQEALSTIATLNSQMQLLPTDVSAESAKLHEALQSRAAEGSLAAHGAEERCKVLETQVERTRRGRAGESGSPEQAPKAAEGAIDTAASFGSCSANALQPPSRPSSRNRTARSRREVRQAPTLAKAPPADFYKEVRQERQEVRQVSTLANAAQSDRYEELKRYRNLWIGEVTTLMFEAQKSRTAGSCLHEECCSLLCR